jgi:hypothetical protein
MFTATYVYSCLGFAFGLMAYFKDRLFHRPKKRQKE